MQEQSPTLDVLVVGSEEHQQSPPQNRKLLVFLIRRTGPKVEDLNATEYPVLLFAVDRSCVFLQISMKTVAHRHRHSAYHNKH